MLAALLAAGANAAEPDYRALIAHTTAAYTVRSTVGPLETPLSPSWADFLLDHPDLAASLVRRYNIAPYVITMRGPRQSYADDGDGTKGLVTMVEHEGERRLYYGEGTHDSRLFPTIRAAAVIQMDVSPVAPEGCPRRVRSSFTVFVKLRNPLLSGMVKVLRPFVRDTIIRKFTRAFLVAHHVGRLLAEKPKEVSADILAYEGLSAEDREQARALIASLEPQPAACLAPPRPEKLAKP
jgi:hypothetical protein